MLCEIGVTSWKPLETLGKIVRFPAVGTSYEVAAYLKRLIKNDKVKVKITSKHNSEPAVTWNVVGEVKGRILPDEVIIAGAHFDGYDIAPGEMDDAARACVVMEAARLLAIHKDSIMRTIRFITFPGEKQVILVRQVMF